MRASIHQTTLITAIKTCIPYHISLIIIVMKINCVMVWNFFFQTSKEKESGYTVISEFISYR